MSRPSEHRSTLHIAALGAGGELDESWGAGGYRAIGARSASMGGAADGSLVIATDRTRRCVRREVRPALRVVRLDARGVRVRARRHVLGRKRACSAVSPGEIDVDSRGRITMAGGLGRGGGLVRLRSDLRRDTRFGRRGIVRVTSEPVWWQRMQLAHRRSRGFAVGFTTTDGGDAPHAHAALVGRRGRFVRSRRLPVMRRYPTSDVLDVVFDHAGPTR